MISRGTWFSLVLALLPLALCQENEPLPSSWPHEYPGKPSGDFSPAWQNYFRVTDPLPNVTFPLSRSYAGNLPVGRGSPNNTLFFWGFEKSAGSLTAKLSGRVKKEPWGLWLNGGPGSSSFYGFFFENGPISMSSDYKLTKNRYSWDNLADYFWIDQPVGIGHATSTSDGYIQDEDMMGRDFMGFLANLVKVFPSLATRPLHITGESYAGMYIPYILKAYFEMPNPPVKIANIAIGDGTIGPGVAWNLAPTLSTLEIFPQLIGYDPAVYRYFKQQSKLCGYDLNLTYPQNGLLPDIPLRQPSQRTIPWLLTTQSAGQTNILHHLAKRYAESDAQNLTRRARTEASELWKRDKLSDRANGTLDPWYGCFLWDMAMDYALNYTYPWNEVQMLDFYDLASVLNPQPNKDAAPFMNDPRTRKALHAPQSKDWALSTWHVFGPLDRDPSPVPQTFMTELATNATAKNVGIILYHGNNDFLVPKLGSEIVIQNTTFGGIQGFTKKPATPWYDDTGKFAGIVHQERGWKYVLFYGAGHLLPYTVPRAAYRFVRDFVLGNDPLGSVVGNQVIGGQDPRYAVPNIQAGDELYLGAGKTESTWTAPAATRSAWKSFIATETATTTTTTATSRTKPPKPTSTRPPHFHRAQRDAIPEPTPP